MKAGQGPFPPSLPAGLITGSGTPNTIPIWTGAQTLGDSLMTQVGGVVFFNAHLEFSKPTLQPYRFTTSFSNTQLALQGQTSGQITALHFFNKDGDGTDNVELSLFGVGTPASTGNRERARWYFNAATNSYYFNTQASGTGVLRALWLGTYNAGKVQIKCNPDNSLDLFEQSVAPETPEFRLSGRNATDSAKRTLIVNIHPTIDNCVLFSNVGKYCFDDNIDIIRTGATLITFSSAVTGDADFRFRLNADGKIQWGPGGGAPDTTLERTGIAKLKITNTLGINITPVDQFHVAGITRFESGSSQIVLNVYRTGSATRRMAMNSEGKAVFNSNLAPGTANVSLLAGGMGLADIPLRVQGSGGTHTGNLFEIWKGGSDFRVVVKPTGRMGLGELLPVSAIDIDDDSGGTDMGYITGEELSGDAAAPAANHFALYAKDVGGKVAIYARFPTGAVQQIAIEP